MTEQTESDTERRMARLESEHAVRDLCSAFCQGLDHRDEALFLGIWAPDAEWVIGADVHRGTEEIRATWKASIDSVIRSRHMAANVMVTWLDDRASARSELYGQATMADGSLNQVIFTMHDDLVRADGRWVIGRRVVDVYPPPT